MLFTHKIDDDISLILMQPAIAEQMFAIVSAEQDYLNEWLPWPKSQTDIKIVTKTFTDMLLSFAEKKSLTCAIIYKGDLCGVAGFNSLDMLLKKGVIGYWLSQKFQGNGIMTRVVKYYIRHAFEDMGLEKIETAHAIGNISSQKVIEKVGFIKEGIVKNAENLHGKIVDHIIYGMMKSDWENPSSE